MVDSQNIAQTSQQTTNTVDANETEFLSRIADANDAEAAAQLTGNPSTSGSAYQPVEWKSASEAGQAQGATQGPVLGGDAPVQPTQGTFRTPADGIDGVDWRLASSVDRNNDGKRDEVTDIDGYESEYFQTGDGGEVRLMTTGQVPQNTGLTGTAKTELRAVVNPVAGYNDPSNKWVLESAPESSKSQAGAVDGRMTSTISVDSVSTSGDPYRSGRAIVAEIEAPETEPLRVYYELEPGSGTKGSILFSHESADGIYEDFYTLIDGSRTARGADGEGIELGEIFNLDVEMSGTNLIVTVIQEDGTQYEKTVDISSSGYDADGQFLNFKLGAVDPSTRGGNTPGSVDITVFDAAPQYAELNTEVLTAAEDLSESDDGDQDNELFPTAARGNIDGEEYHEHYEELYDGYIDEGYDHGQAHVMADIQAKKIASEASASRENGDAYAEAFAEFYEEFTERGFTPEEADVLAEIQATRRVGRGAESPSSMSPDEIYDEAYDKAYEERYEEAHETAYERFRDDGLSKDVSSNLAEDYAEDIAENYAEDMAEDAVERARPPENVVGGSLPDQLGDPNQPDPLFDGPDAQDPNPVDPIPLSDNSIGQPFEDLIEGTVSEEQEDAVEDDDYDAEMVRLAAESVQLSALNQSEIGDSTEAPDEDENEPPATFGDIYDNYFGGQ